jgi:hypothetical protein
VTQIPPLYSGPMAAPQRCQIITTIGNPVSLKLIGLDYNYCQGLLLCKDLVARIRDLPLF